MFQDFSISDLEGDIFDGKKRKRDDSDSEDAADDVEGKPLKKKSKKKTKKEVSSFPGKFVLLKPPQDESEDIAEDAAESSAIRTVRDNSVELFPKVKLNRILDMEPDRSLVGRDSQSSRRNEVQQSN